MGRHTFSRAVAQGRRVSFWNMYPMREPAPWPSMPATCVLPSAGARRPAMTLSMVDLPQPDGPTMETNSPSLTARLTRSRARVAPKAMLRPETETFCGTARPLLVPEMLELGRYHLVVGDVGLHRADLFLELVAQAHGLLGDGGRVGVPLDGHDGADDRGIHGGKELLADAHRRLGILAHALERLHHGPHHALGDLRIGGQPLVARLQGGEGHVLEKLRSLSEARVDEVARELELMHGDGPRGLPTHVAVDLARLEGGGGRADPAHRDDGHVAVGLEPGVLEEGAQGEIRAAPRPRHAELGALEILHLFRRMVLADHEMQRVPVLEGKQVLGAESFLREDQRPLHHGAARIDRAADHGRGHFGSALEVHELDG